MDDHSLFPVTPTELGVLILRLQHLDGRVMSAKEWQSILSATRQVLPHRKKELIAPSGVDLQSFSTSDAGRILGATVTSFSSPETYKNNQRYAITNWITLVRNFYELASYRIPAQTLGFARELLQSARKHHDDSFVRAISVVAGNEPMLVRQVTSPSDLERWRKSLADRLGESRRRGAECRELARDGELKGDDYDEWYFESEEVLDLTAQFYRSFGYPIPNDHARLRDLRDEVERPTDEDDEDLETYVRDASANGGQHFWTVERIFEDL
jgi:hypothetical protein